jgi:PKD repeat protein
MNVIPMKPVLTVSRRFGLVICFTLFLTVGWTQSPFPGPPTLSSPYSLLFSPPTTIRVDATTLPYSESFETGLGLWQQASQDDADWSWQPDGKAGQRIGTITAYNQAHYLSLPSPLMKAGEHAGLVGPPMHLKGVSSPFVYFTYYLAGMHPGSLDLAVSTDDGLTWNASIWQTNEATAQRWQQAKVNLADYAGQTIRLRLRAVQGSSDGTVAIDAIHLKQAMAIPNDVVYAYRLIDETFFPPNPSGPVWFNPNNINVLYLIQNQSSQDYLAGGTWALGKWYASNLLGQQIVTVDTATGFRQIVGSTGGVYVSSLAYDASAGILYATGDSNFNSANNLYQVDACTGTATLIGTNTGHVFATLACSPGGTLYTIDLISNEMFSFDKATGAATSIGSIGYNANYTQDMEFDPQTGTLYLTAYHEELPPFLQSGEWRTGDTLTGATVDLGDFQNDAQLAGMTMIGPALVPPVANFTVSSTTVCAGSSVTFLNQSTGNALSFEWQITGPDTLSSLSSNPVLAFTSAGVYDVSLIASGPGCLADTLLLPGLLTVSVGTAVDAGPDLSVCRNAGPLSLTSGTPAGGAYSGQGVSGNIFSPGPLNTSSYDITYTYQDTTTGCSGTDTFQIEVLAPPNVDWFWAGSFCADDPPVTLSGATPAGGTYSGLGVTSGVFYPASVPWNDAYSIVYTYVDPATGCSKSIIQSALVYEAVSASFAPMPDLCVSAGPQVLTGGSPSGGQYSGPGITGGTFNPSVAGIGSHSLLYSYTDPDNGNFCSGSATTTVNVTEAPVATWLELPQVVCSQDSPLLLPTGAPSGGTYVGQGVVGQTFDPFLAGPGTHPLGYVVAQNGCTDTAFQSITVFFTPPVPTITQIGDTLVSSWPGTNQWYLDGNLLPGINGPQLLPSTNGAYTVEAVGDGGCSTVADDTVAYLISHVVASGWPIGWQVYPNPTHGPVTLSLRGLPPGPVQVALFHATGQAVSTWSLTPQGPDLLTGLNLPSLAEGLYALRIQAAGMPPHVALIRIR